jgi:transcriptional regulator GlxA family with amidase domain
MRTIAFFIPESCHILDLSGPLQAFYEAIEQGADYQLDFLSLSDQVKTAQSINLNGFKHYSQSDLSKDDLIIIPGIHGDLLTKNKLTKLGSDFYRWLNEQYEKAVTICSICNAAFILAESGLLNGKQCTTHWERFEQFKAQYPAVTLVENRLFVKDNRIYSSAGISSGIDLALDIINEHYGALFTSKVAKVMLVYIRRDSSFDQFSAYLDFRNHLNEKIHDVQNYIIKNPERNFSINDLSEFIYISPRHLSRLFKQETGITIKEYSHRVKLEFAKVLINNKNLQIEEIARKSGFESAQHFRRVWKSYFLNSPSRSR